MPTNTATTAPEAETFHLADLEDVLTCHHSKLRFLYNVAASLVESGGRLKLDNDGVYGLDLILGDLLRHTKAMQDQVTKAYAARKGA